MRENTRSDIEEMSQKHGKSVEVGMSCALGGDEGTRELHGVWDRQEACATP